MPSLDQKSKVKSKSDKEKFKNKFTERLIKFSVEIIIFIKLLRKDNTFWVITDQLIRSSTSIGANVIEAKAASSKRDYMKLPDLTIRVSSPLLRRTKIPPKQKILRIHSFDSAQAFLRRRIKYFKIALKSANETKYWLLLTIRLSNSPTSARAHELLNEVEEVANILGSSVLTLKGKK